MKTPVIVGLAALATLAIGLAGLSGWDHEGALAASRLTARWAFAWFIVAWSASSVARLWPGGWRTALLRRRRAVGLGFAAGHFVHAGFFTLAIAMFGVERPLAVFVGGGLGYVFIAAMAATSNDASVRALGPKRWKLLHTVGGWYVLAIFLNSYAGRLAEKPLVGLYGVGLIAVAVALRIAAYLKGRAKLQPA